MDLSYIEAKTDLVINKMTREIYEELKLSGSLNDDQLYIITDDEDINNTLSNYYKKTETSSSEQIENGLNQKNSTYVDQVQNDIKIQHINGSDYNYLVKYGGIDSNTLYIVSSDYLNMANQQIKNLKTPTDNYDAVNKKYVYDNTVLYTQNQSLTDAQKTQAGVNAGFRYALRTKTLKNCTYAGTTGLSCQIEDYSINTVDITSDNLPVFLFLPKALDDRARDFVIKLIVTSSNTPSIAYVPYGDETVDYDTNDDAWSTIEQGTNIIAFTEMSR